MGWIEELHGTLDKRAMPEDVARIILAGNTVWPAALRHELARAAGSRPAWHVTSMADDFERPEDCGPQLAAAARMFGCAAEGVSPADPAQVRLFIAAMGDRLGGWCPGDDWKRHRLNRERRALKQAVAAGFGLELPPLASKRQYNRHVRVLRNLEDKRVRMERGLHLRRLILIGRSGFACDIPLERFTADPAAACFIAYYAARKNKRRMFTLASKENPIDRAADIMLRHVLGSQGSEWRMLMLAMACPQPEILARLGDGTRGELMGRWWSVMRGTAEELRGAWPEKANKLSMIVRQGMDSSTWNTMAQAFNSARSGWINCATASGAEALLEPFCPGNAMRLMAADLAYWHRASGGDVDPDTTVWARLPMPWDVIDGTSACTRADVEAACAEAAVDPAARGWTAPRAKGAVAEFTPTPELVHGVAIADPQWASLLRRAGAFSGKGIRDGAEGIEVPEGMIVSELPVKDDAGSYYGTA
jgi:hypothetical protein